ncbi:hypothetical protein [Blastococcus sp. URHD0036]|uniref:hypothetical protein n=1 Tax=Blastococcus sp. URHD0036 TaxID=1380356 RepID=UPI000496622A|nr:hypothetical protein [Blastococcus sp. URHD0036]
MVEKVVDDVGAVLEQHSGLARRVLEYSLTMKRLVDAAKAPGATVDDWAPLADMVAVDDFERVGNFLEVMRWPEYVQFLARWASSAQWECSFRRVTEHDGVVFLELEERSGAGEGRTAVNSVSVYEFDAAGKIRHLDIYLQMPMPRGAMPAAYE